MSHISPIRAAPVLRLPDSSTFLWLGVVTARSADRPVLTRGLVPSGTRRAASCPHLPPGSPPRAVTARYRFASPTSRSEPRLLSARTLRGSALPAYRSPTLCVVAPPSPLLPDGLPPLPPTTSIASSLCPALYPSLSDGLAPSEPRSVRADVIPGSERYAAHRHASAGRGSVPRRPGERREASPGRPSCGACEISRPRQHRPARSHIALPLSSAAWGWS